MPTPPRRHALLAALPVLLACALAPPPAAAQPTTTGGYNSNMMAGGERFSAPMVVLLVALIAAFFFIGFFSIYIRHCGRDAAGSGNTTIPAAAILALSRRQQQQQRGLDAEVVASFPTMRYAEAKALRVGNEAALECAVCLSEFDDDEQLTLLPKCSHAFHPDCIGEWLASHVTCPVCRCNLEPEEPAAHDGNSSGEAAALQQEDGAQPAVVIDVDHEGTDDEEERRRKEAMELKQIGSQRRAIRSRSGRPSTRLARSHSTGHSVAVQLAGDLERFTLRLPEHVRRGMVTAGEESLRRWRGVGEGSSRRGGGARSARLARSDRWPSLIGRTFSARLPFWAAPRRTDAEGGGGEGPTATGRPKRASVADGAAASPKGSVRFDCLGGGASGARVGAVAGEEEEKPIVRQA